MSRDDVYYSDTRARNIFGYRVPDDSMAPEFRAGDIAVVNPNLSGRPGDYAVARSGGKTLLGRISAAGDGFEAAAARPPTTFSGSDVLGRVVERKRFYR